MKKIIHVILFCILFVSPQVNAQKFLGGVEIIVDTIATGLDIPWEIKVGPDNWIWSTERFGRIQKYNPTTKEVIELVDISAKVVQNSESGLLGFAFHPDFQNQPYLYTAYTYSGASGITEKLVRFEYSNDQLINETTILDGIRGNSTHIGARLMFMPDTTLLMTTGDAQVTSSPQDVNSLSGKTLRLNVDGSIPDDNPYSGSYTYTWGNRNAQGLAYGPHGIIYCSEHGASNDDEFQIIEAGRNYGWPNVEGECDSWEQNFCTANNVKEPLLTWSPTIAPSDIIWYDKDLFPVFQNKMLLTVLKDKELIAIELSEDGQSVVDTETYFEHEYNRLRDICFDDLGVIYLATSGFGWFNNTPFTHSIIRIKPKSLSSHEIESKQLKVYPNPSKGLVTVETPFENEFDYQLLDVTGRIVLSKVSSTSKITFDLNGLKPGIYQLSVLKGEKILHRKIVKN